MTLLSSASLHIFPFWANVKSLPSRVQVRRCEGECNYHRTCSPSSTRLVRVPIYVSMQTNDDQSQLLMGVFGGLQFQKSRTCGEVEIEEHQECKCGCSLEARHCKPPRVSPSAAKDRLAGSTWVVGCVGCRGRDKEVQVQSEWIIGRVIDAAGLIWNEKMAISQIIWRWKGIKKRWEGFMAEWLG